MKPTLHHIARIIGATVSGADTAIDHLIIDSRKVFSPEHSLFFALKGPRRDGHSFITELYKKGIRHFVISEPFVADNYPGAVFLKTSDTLAALQQLAAFYRHQFKIPVIAITGSNGKTIVKEWLYQLLHTDFSIVKNPKSYNSQIGVPLSLWQMEEQHHLGIFEAGISQKNEMATLRQMIDPTIGVLTNIGEAHSEGFDSKEEKLNEKLQLFTNCEMVIGKEENLETFRKKNNIPVITWGEAATNDMVIKHIEKAGNGTTVTVCFGGADIPFFIPFTDDASVENAITCFLTATQLGMDKAILAGRMSQLHAINMRLELKKGINHCTIINDSYSADITSLDIALDFLDQQAGLSKKTVILSDLQQQSGKDENRYAVILKKLNQHGISRLIGIGEKITAALQHNVTGTGLAIQTELYLSTEAFIRQFKTSQFREETILIKGARVFGFEEIVQMLEQKVHQTVLEINLNALAHNLRQYQSQLKPQTRIMAMVKAFAYGSGGGEIAGILQYNKVDYLGVAYVDEGVELRKSGISLPIMVLNPEAHAFEAITDNRLEPDIFSFEMLEQLDAYLKSEGIQQYPVHIELETGMNRLGFPVDEIEKLSAFINSSSSLRIQSVFTHLAAGEDPKEDAFTFSQYEKFISAARQLEEQLGYSFLKHISNSAAIIRLPQLQMDMVRLGIGLYGVDSAASNKIHLQPVATLKSTIAQVKHLKAGESISYNRKTILQKDSVIATVRIGYADGYPRKLGNGMGKIFVGGKLAPVAGTVCMDMTMIDITGIPGISEGDEVIIFGKELPVQQLAAWAGTIPYEIMTGISQRVKRVYFEE